MTTLHTLGHSSHPIERFIALLHQQGITTLVDVRSRPYSRWAPQFKQHALARALQAEGVTYVFLGAELGGRPEGAEFYNAHGHVDYERRAQAPEFRAGIERLIEIAHQKPTAILCAEEDPNRCHRRQLVTPTLERRGVTVQHIRGDGRVQSEEELWREGTQMGLFG